MGSERAIQAREREAIKRERQVIDGQGRGRVEVTERGKGERGKGERGRDEKEKQRREKER